MCIVGGAHETDDRGPGGHGGSVDLAYSGDPYSHISLNLGGCGSPGREGDSGGTGAFGGLNVPGGQGCRDGPGDPSGCDPGI